MSARYVVGDTRDVIATLSDGSVDLVLTSPPFYQLRSYLPADHPDKHREIGGERDPGTFIDTLLALTADWRRVLAPHGTICVELGDKYSGSGGAGGDYDDGGLREGQAKFKGRSAEEDGLLAKCMTLVPELYRIGLAYGRNPLTGAESPAGRWRVRNVVRWVRPNPPVGALCVDDQTEALTLDGWKRHDELHDGDLIATYDPATDSCHFAPAKFVRWERENEQMVVINKKATSQWLTADHRCYVRTRKHGPHVRLASQLTNQCETLLCAPFDDPGGAPPVTPERAALLGWFIAEGSPHRRQARIIQSLTANPQKVAAIRVLLERDGADFTETSYVARYNDSTIVTFTIKGELADWLNLHQKRLPMQYVTTWPDTCARALFDALIDGDGHRRKNAEGMMFHQQDEAVADAVQVLALRLGYRATKSWQPTMRIWQITIGTMYRWTHLRKWEGTGIHTESYTGVVWCPMVETSFWLARRNGRTFVTGNSDKFRPATSDLVIACTAVDRWFDLDAVRTEHKSDPEKPGGVYKGSLNGTDHRRWQDGETSNQSPMNPAGAPPLDWWKISPTGYEGAHYATWPAELCVKPIEAMCPRRVCLTCGKPSRREVDSQRGADPTRPEPYSVAMQAQGQRNGWGTRTTGSETTYTTTGWGTCGCPGTDGIRLDGYHTGTGWRPGVVLDPFCGTATTLVVAHGHGRDSIGIDLDPRNVALARERLGFFLEVDTLQPEDVA